MSRIYGRQYDAERISKDLLSHQYEEYKKDMSNTSWDEVVKATSGLDIYLSPKVISLLDRQNYLVTRNVFQNETATFIFDDKKVPSTIVYPSYRAKEDYKTEFVKFLGEIISSEQKAGNEFGNLIPLMFEYFYLSLNKENPEKEFELRNISKCIIPAKRFLREYNLYQKIPNFYNISQYEQEILNAVQMFSSFDASLQLIELMKTDSDKVLQMVDEIVQKKGSTYDILADSGIYSYGYKSLKKTINERKK